MSDNENNNIIGLVSSKEPEKKFQLTIHYQDKKVPETYIGDFFGVSVENADFFMIGKSMNTEDVLPTTFIYIPRVDKILVEEVFVENE